MNPEIRPAGSDDLEACVEIIRGLEDFFTEDVPAKFGANLERHDGWVIAEAEEVVGFVIVDRRSSQVAEILWTAVEPSRRNTGRGTRLLNHVLGVLRDQGTVLVEVKTLDGSADYEPYKATEAFYQRNGFVQIDCIDPLAGRPPGNPAAIYVAALQRTK
jgi:GNAT superfamily N-acetyltransferase